jgi:hypothetical protein
MVTNLKNEMDRRPKARADSFARAARYRDEYRVDVTPTNTFWYRTPVRSLVTSNRPAWVLVPSRAPMAPKTVPRIPRMAGMRIRRPGSSSSVPVIEARVIPATKEVAAPSRRAANPWRRVRRSERR